MLKAAIVIAFIAAVYALTIWLRIKALEPLDIEGDIEDGT